MSPRNSGTDYRSELTPSTRSPRSKLRKKPTYSSKHKRSVPISDALQSKKLSKQNLEDLQDHISSLPQQDSVLEWISLSSTITNSGGVGPVAKGKRLALTFSSIAPGGGPKHSLSYAHSLYRLGIFEVKGDGTIPPAPKNDKVFSLVTNLRPLSTSIKKWFLRAK